MLGYKLVGGEKSIVCLHSLLSPEFPVSASWCREGTFHMGDLFLPFREAKEGQNVLLALAVS